MAGGSSVRATIPNALNKKIKNKNKNTPCPVLLHFVAPKGINPARVTVHKALAAAAAACTRPVRQGGTRPARRRCRSGRFEQAGAALASNQKHSGGAEALAGRDGVAFLVSLRLRCCWVDGPPGNCPSSLTNGRTETNQDQHHEPRSTKCSPPSIPK
ncbi:hypothetical protein GGTG_12197 [Gaeumannomyces tritici R3-111a-1]|uniref:Uncharacterized protein n=1 Tax=Gaeumannomyces tritici (strain R3-111a-1) TaxID=644352 RepID=J3PFC0_GAET3|nr:hypothetical protein GGTG_12197 [Gaeumannomyces tritici R3-111a-1]EJT70022.1 hypothetical protein GGTG_12197 [Gaeumannomyces tritici R3-111a-1]